MKKPTPEASSTESVLRPLVTPSPIRLVQAFQEAAESSRPESDPADESLAIEILLIAGDASFAALSRIDELFHQIVYNDGGSVRFVDRRAIEEGYDLWLVGADALVGRLKALENLGYESESFVRFSAAYATVRGALDEAKTRWRLERQALRNDQLGQLVSKLQSSQKEENTEGVQR